MRIILLRSSGRRRIAQRAEAPAGRVLPILMEVLVWYRKVDVQVLYETPKTDFLGHHSGLGGGLDAVHRKIPDHHSRRNDELPGPVPAASIVGCRHGASSQASA